MRVIHDVVQWGKVIVLGVVLGLGIQFVSAWTNPTVAPPGGNVAGPLTTGVVAQERLGALTVKGTMTTNRLYDLTKVGDTLVQDLGYFSDPNGTSMLNTVNVLGNAKLYQTAGYALQTYGNVDSTKYTKAKDPVGSLEVNDVFLRSTGKWASEKSAWTDVSLGSDSDFDIDCQYRVTLKQKNAGTIYIPWTGETLLAYFTGVHQKHITYIAHQGVVSHIDSNSKNTYRVNGAASNDWPDVLKIEERCDN